MTITYLGASRCVRANMTRATVCRERAVAEPDRSAYWLEQAHHADELARIWCVEAEKLRSTDTDQ